jgi:antitoxin HicB
MKYTAIIGEVKQHWFGYFPDFAGVFIVTATTRPALLKKLEYNLGEYIPLHQGKLPKAKVKSILDIPPDELRGLKNPEAVMVEVTQVNPLSLEIGRLIDSSQLTAAQIAARVGTTTSALSRMRNPKYTRHNFETVRRLAAAVGTRVTVHFEPLA